MEDCRESGASVVTDPLYTLPCMTHRFPNSCGVLPDSIDDVDCPVVLVVPSANPEPVTRRGWGGILEGRREQGSVMWEGELVKDTENLTLSSSLL